MNRRVLLIDPDPAFRDTLTAQLGRYHVVVMTEPDAERALAIGNADVPSLVVIGVDEPDKSGFKVFQKCKKGALGKVPIVLVTRSVSPENLAKHQHLKTHADAYLDKRTMTTEELVGKIDGLIGLGDLDEEALDIPVEDDIPLEIADGDVVLDETVGEDDGRDEFANEARTVGPGEGVAFDHFVEAETDAAFAALLGDEPAPAPEPAPVPEPAAEAAAAPEPIAEDLSGVPEPVPDPMSPPEPAVEEAVPAIIEDGERRDPELEHSFSGQPIVDPTLGDEGSGPAPVATLESAPAIPIDEIELLAIEDDEAEAPPPPPTTPPPLARPEPTRPPANAFVHEEKTVARPVVHEAPTVARSPIILDEAIGEPRAARGRDTDAPERGRAAEPPRASASGPHAPIDLGLDVLAAGVQNEQSGLHDRRALRKLGDLERQVGQLKAELERARSEAGGKGGGREKEFLNLRESLLQRDKELRAAKDELAHAAAQLADTQTRLAATQDARTQLEAKHAQAEQQLVVEHARATRLDADTQASAGRIRTLEQELDERTRELADTSAGKAQLAKDLEAERALREASASQAERALREEQAQLVRRHDEALAAAHATAQAEREAALARLREELEIAQAAAVAGVRDELEAANAAALAQLREALEAARGDAVEELRRANAMEHEAIVADLERRHASELVGLKADHAEVIRARDQAVQQLEAELAATRSQAGDAAQDAEARRATELAQLTEQHTTELARLTEHHTTELARLTEHHAGELSRSTEQHASELAAERGAHEAAVAALRAEAEEAAARAAHDRRELEDQHARSAGEADAQHRGELERLAQERAQLADAARRAAESHAQAIAEAHAKHTAELEQLRETAEREAAEHRATLQATRRAAEEAAGRHEAERDAAAKTHEETLAARDAEHERALALLRGEHERVTAKQRAEHTAALAKLEAELTAGKEQVVRELSTERDELRRGLSSARDAHKRTESELASAVQTIADRNAELRAHTAAIAERDQRIAELRKELDALEQENASYQEQVLRAYQKIKTDEAMVARARKAMAIALTVLDDSGKPTGDPQGNAS